MAGEGIEARKADTKNQETLQHKKCPLSLGSLLGLRDKLCVRRPELRRGLHHTRLAGVRPPLAAASGVAVHTGEEAALGGSRAVSRERGRGGQTCRGETVHGFSMQDGVRHG